MSARFVARPLSDEKVEEIYWITLEYLSYRSDLSACGFHLFGPLKEDLGGRRFHNNQSVEMCLDNWLSTRSTLFYKEAIKKLPNRWKKCIIKRRDYIEKSCCLFNRKSKL